MGPCFVDQVVDFVGLNGTNEVPLGIGWHLWYFFNDFLHIVFTKMTLPTVVTSFQQMDRFGFGDGDELGGCGIDGGTGGVVERCFVGRCG